MTREKVRGGRSTSPHHVSDLQVTVGEHYGIGGRGNR